MMRLLFTILFLFIFSASYSQLFSSGGNQSILSTVNTTTTTLNASDTFVGEWQRNTLPDVMVSCKTDANGVLFFEFSDDAVNVNAFPVDGYDISRNIHAFHTAVKGSRYFRARFINTDTINQTYFRLYTYFGQFRQSILPRGASISTDADATVVRPTDYFVDVSQGLVQNAISDNKFGYGQVTTVLKPITSSGAFMTPSSAQTLEILSSDADDSLNGAGAWKVVIIGLNSLWQNVQDTVSLNGTSAVALNTPFTRVYRMYILQSGVYANSSTSSHQGTITLRASGGGATWAQIGVYDATFGVGQSQIGGISVTETQTLYIEAISISIESNKLVDIFLFQRNRINTVSAPFSAFRTAKRWVGVSQSVEQDFKVPIKFDGSCDVVFMGRVTSGTANVSINFTYVIIED